MHLDLNDLDGTSLLLAHVVDSAEKVEILVYVHRESPRAVRSADIARRLHLTPRIVAESLASLFDAGIIRTTPCADDGGWQLDPRSVWSTSVDTVVDMYEHDHRELFALMKHVATEYIRTADVRSSMFTFVYMRKPPDPS